MKNLPLVEGHGASKRVTASKIGIPARRNIKVLDAWRAESAAQSPDLARGIGCYLLALLMAALLTGLVMPFPSVAQISQELQLGLESHKAGKLKDAIEIYTEVLRKTPQSAEALNWRGMAYDDLNQLDDALADFNKAIDLSPKYADAYNNRGEVYRKKKKFDQALADYRMAVEHDKNFPEAHYNMGLVLEAQKKSAVAARSFTQYLRLKPTAEDKEQVQGKIASLQKAAAQEPKPARPPGATQAGPPKPGEPQPGTKPLPRPGKPVAPPAPPGMDTGIPGMPSIPIPPELAFLMASLGIISVILPLVGYLFTSVMLFLIAKKTATALPWLAFIPIANLYLMVQIAGKPIWWLGLFLLPVLSPVVALIAAVDPTGGIVVGVLSLALVLGSLVAWFFISLGIAAARGKSTLWGVLFFIPCTSPIAMGYLGLSK